MRILLAEDEKALSDVLVAILKKNNYSVDAVYDGQEAIDYAETNLYDVVLLDVMMPKKDGLQVVAHLRARKNNVPVIMLTAKTQTEDKIIGLDSGADDYITKPFEMKELLARIRAVARRRNPMTDSIYRLETSRNSHNGGFGIGLSSVQAIVLAHKGKISAHSADGKSLCIKILL